MKCEGDTIPRTFSKKSKLSISLDQYCKVSYSLFLYAKLRTQKGMELVSLPHFRHDSLKKNIYLVTFYYLTKFHCQVTFT